MLFPEMVRHHFHKFEGKVRVDQKLFFDCFVFNNKHFAVFERTPVEQVLPLLEKIINSPMTAFFPHSLKLNFLPSPVNG